MRRSSLFLFFSAANLLLFLTLPLHARLQSGRDAKPVPDQLKNLQLTDLCLATEARYTRHPALSDYHAPFQEHPMALEHFPSGSMIFPPYLNGRTP